MNRVDSRLAASGLLALVKPETVSSLPNQVVGVFCNSGCQRSTWGASPKKQAACYNGEKHAHTIKFQLLMDKPTGAILQVAMAQANEHDVTLAREQTEPLPLGTICLADAGHQGLVWEGGKLLSPFKKPRNRELDPLQKAFNRRRAQLRVKVEHCIRTLKIFRILKGVYRNRHKRFEQHLQRMAALVKRLRGY